MSTSRPSWTVLDTAFGNGSNFLAYCARWRADAQHPPMLHYVGLLQTEHRTPWAPELDTLLEDIGPGFHRYLLDAGRISLTLCIGATKAMLTEQRMQADQVHMDTQATEWDLWGLKALARCCRRGARLNHIHGPDIDSAMAQEAGFVLRPDSDGASAPVLWFNPTWNILKRNGAITETPTAPSSCAVIGAGLSGGSVAHALALRGWQVTVLDRHSAPAGGASGLPLGLVVPHVSADDSTRSRMSRNGSRLMLQYASQLLQQDTEWARTGVLERREVGDHWHKHAGWIQPTALVQAWLNHPGIRFMGNAQVQALQRSGDQWLLQDASQKSLATAHHVVFANAMGCQQLLGNLWETVALEADVGQKLALLQALHGTLSSGDSTPEAHSDSPVNGNGSYVPAAPVNGKRRWFAGSTFELDARQIDDISQQHHANLAKLNTLLPDVGRALQNAFETGKVDTWNGTRCVSHDRMPLVGALQSGDAPTLWISAAMGARGLSFSALCAQWLVAQMCAEPSPMEASLARSLDVKRQRRVRS